MNKSADNYHWGLIFGDERQCLYNLLIEVCDKFSPVVIIEVGCRELYTGKALVNICRDKGVEYVYYGLDIARYGTPVLLPNMNHLIVDANDENILARLPSEFHFVLIDACHCKDCVVNQGRLYSRRLAKGGIIAFHDTAIESQNRSGSCHSETHNRQFLPVGVLDGLKELNLTENGYELVCEVKKGAGIICYRKL